MNDVVLRWNYVWPQKELVLTRADVLRYERGQVIPRADRVGMLADCFNVEPNYFYVRTREELLERIQPLRDEVLREEARVEQLLKKIRTKTRTKPARKTATP
jgi:transcriptional regulator with XRE-family HTH domain